MIIVKLKSPTAISLAMRLCCNVGTRARRDCALCYFYGYTVISTDTPSSAETGHTHDPDPVQ